MFKQMRTQVYSMSDMILINVTAHSTAKDPQALPI